MEKTLDDMRRDALIRSQASKTEKKPLEEAVDTIVRLFLIARKEGILALEKEKHDITSDFLYLLVTMLVDTSSPELMTEIATNIYWMDEPEGVQALVDYIYLRGILLIQKGWAPKSIKASLQTLYDPGCASEWYYM